MRRIKGRHSKVVHLFCLALLLIASLSFPLSRIPAKTPASIARFRTNNYNVRHPAERSRIEISLLSVMEDRAENAEQAGMTTSYQVPNDDADKHLAIVVAGTFWWYLYTSFRMVYQSPPIFDLPQTYVQALAAFVTISQILVYFGCYKLARANTLSEAQSLVVGMTGLCVPADVVTTLVNPTGSSGITILVFAEITMFFGIYLAHYLRKASFREVPPEEHVLGETKQDEGVKSIIETLRDYRPPPQQQATFLAASFTRSFVAFTIAAGYTGQCVMGGIANPLVLGSLIVVVLHTALECTLTTVFPGAGLDRFNSFLVLEALLYLVHMFAASLASLQSVFGNGLIDQALFIWLFGSAVAQVINRTSRLLGKVNFDEMLGLSDLDGRCVSEKRYIEVAACSTYGSAESRAASRPSPKEVSTG